MASIRRRNGKYQVQIRVGSYNRSQSFHIHMYGDGEISIYFAHRDKSGGWQKDDIFCFSRYRFERYSGQSISISDNMNAILRDLQFHQISDDVAAKINAECTGDWQPIDPKYSRKRFW